MSDLLKLVQAYQSDHDLMELLESGGSILSDPAAARKELQELPEEQRQQAEEILEQLLNRLSSKEEEIEKELADILQTMKSGQKSADACLSYSQADAHGANNRSTTKDDEQGE